MGARSFDDEIARISTLRPTVTLFCIGYQCYLLLKALLHVPVEVLNILHVYDFMLQYLYLIYVHILCKI